MTVSKLKHQKYHRLTPDQRRELRNRYVTEQEGLCFYCKQPLNGRPPEKVTSKPIKWDRFPKHFLRWPVHLQHDHDTGLTEGAVHAYCNAVMWQYEGR